MARILTETERALTATALEAYGNNLRGAEATGVPDVDQLVATRAEAAHTLADAFATSTRASVSSADDKE